MSTAAARATPGLARRLASALYDLLLLAAVVLVATFPFLAFVGDATSGWRRHLLQAWVLGVSGAYFVWFWTHGGRTLRPDHCAVCVQPREHQLFVFVAHFQGVCALERWAVENMDGVVERQGAYDLRVAS